MVMLNFVDIPMSRLIYETNLGENDFLTVKAVFPDEISLKKDRSSRKRCFQVISETADGCSRKAAMCLTTRISARAGHISSDSYHQMTDFRALRKK